MLSRALPLGPLVACALLATCAACDNPAPTAGTTSGGAPPPASATTTATAPTATASASAAPLPTTDPEPVRTAAASATAPPPDAGARPAPTARPTPTARPDAGAGVADAGPVAASDAGAPPAGPALDIARQVDAIFAGKKTFTARFDQQYTLKVSGDPQSSSGVVFIERPSKISFRYDPPNQQRIVSDGVTIKVYLPSDNQMFVTPAGDTQYPGALAFMMGNGIATSFDFAINDKAKYAGVVLDGKPLTPNPSYQFVMFYISKTLLAKADPGAIERVLVLDAQGNRNRFDFKGASQPATIDPAEFTFTPPAGTNVIKR